MGSKARRKLAKREAKEHQRIARARKDHAYKTAHKLIRTGQKVFFREKLNLKGLSQKNQPKQDDTGKYLPNGQSSKSGLNKSWLDAAFGQFFSIFNYIAEKAGVAVIEVNPSYTSQLLSYRDEFVFTNCSIREYWDEFEQVLIDRDINGAINLKRVGLDEFPTIKRRKGQPVIVDSNTDYTSLASSLYLSGSGEARAVAPAQRRESSLENKVNSKDKAISKREQVRVERYKDLTAILKL